MNICAYCGGSDLFKLAVGTEYNASSVEAADINKQKKIYSMQKEISVAMKLQCWSSKAVAKLFFATTSAVHNWIDKFGNNPDIKPVKLICLSLQNKKV